ncbi:hypothetical protein HK101_009595 [Irineochytrium annulatum]|nr:hypothetical protein HK101_009595 [Irineochytrium annulatum]
MEEAKPRPILAVVSINGTHGFQSDWDQFEVGLGHQFDELASVGAEVDSRPLLFNLKSAATQGFETHLGLRAMGDRLSREVVRWFETTIEPSLPHGPRYQLHISIVGHSLGGLIGRYALPLLMDREGSPETSLWLAVDAKRDRFGPLVPMSYIAVSTPHMGVRRVSDGNDWAKKIWSAAIEMIGHLGGVGQTGRELLFLDNGGRESLTAEGGVHAEGSRPILFEMGDPSSAFMQTLGMFKCTLVSAVEGDMLVGFSSSAICSHNPLSPTIGEEADMKIHSVSHFPSDKPVDQLPLFRLSDKTPPEMRDLLTKGIGEDLGASPKGSMHHAEEPFTMPTTKFHFHHASDNGNGKNHYSDQTWMPDSEADLLIPTKLARDLMKASANWRRVNLHLSIPSGLHRTGIHALLVGKVSPLQPPRVKLMATESAYLVARIVVSDFVERIELS